MKKICLAFSALWILCVTNAFGETPICTVSWPPYTVKSESGEISGTHTDLVRHILQELAMTVDINEVPWRRCLKMVEEGNIAFVFSASKKADREAYMTYPQYPLQSLSYVAVTLRGQKSKWGKSKDPLSLKMPVSVPLGYSIGEELSKSGVDVDSSAMNDTQSLDKLLKGRVATIIIEAEVLPKLLAKRSAEEQAKVKILYPAYAEGKNYFLIVSDAYFGGREKAKIVADQIDQIIKDLRPFG